MNNPSFLAAFALCGWAWTALFWAGWALDRLERAEARATEQHLPVRFSHR